MSSFLFVLSPVFLLHLGMFLSMGGSVVPSGCFHQRIMVSFFSGYPLDWSVGLGSRGLGRFGFGFRENRSWACNGSAPTREAVCLCSGAFWVLFLGFFLGKGSGLGTRATGLLEAMGWATTHSYMAGVLETVLLRV